MAITSARNAWSTRSIWPRTQQDTKEPKLKLVNDLAGKEVTTRKPSHYSMLRDPECSRRKRQWWLTSVAQILMKRKRGSFHTLTSVNSVKWRVPRLWVTGVKFRVRGPWVTGARLRVPVRTTHQTELMMINADSLDKKNLNEERNRILSSRGSWVRFTFFINSRTWYYVLNHVNSKTISR